MENYSTRLAIIPGIGYSDDYLEIAGIGYVLGYEYWGKGYATEAAKAVVGFLFNDVNYRKSLLFDFRTQMDISPSDNPHCTTILPAYKDKPAFHKFNHFFRFYQP